MHPRHRLIRSLALLLACALVTAACGDDDTSTAQSGDPAATADETTDDTTETDDTTDDTTTGETGGDEVPPPEVVGVVDSAGNQVVVEGPLERIVSLSPAATEMLFAIGAGDQVVAVDEFSTYPPEAPTTDLSGLTPNVEAIIDLAPDLVVLQGNPNDVVGALETAGIPALQQFAAATLDDTYDQLTQLGSLTGNLPGAEALVDDMRARIDELLDRVPDRTEPLTYYHELDETLYTVTSDTFIGAIYALAGLDNVADPADADNAAFGYPQLSAEFLIDAQPDLIFLADTRCCGQSAETVAERPGFDQLSAVQDGRIFELDDDIASRWGPRVVDFLAAIVDATATVAVES